VRRPAYGRPSDRTVAGMLVEGRGTCSTKHLQRVPHRPAGGVVDVHRHLTAEVDGRRIVLDATLPGGAQWDGRSPTPLACGPGEDHPAGADTDADKRSLEARHCDPAVREPFIAALAAAAP
jgi:hypothetical protein